MEYVLIFKIIRFKNCKRKFDATALALEKLDFPIFESMICIILPLIPQFHRNEFAHGEDDVSMQFR